MLLGDLAALPEQQRTALLMRELEGLGHEQVAAELGVSSQATRMLVVRARDNLDKAAAARDAACLDIRADLAGAHDERRRPSEHARRHVSGCAACRSYRRGLHDVRRQVALLHPGPAILGVLGLGHLAAAGALAGGGKTTAVLAAATVAAVAGVAGVVVIEHPTLLEGDPAPRVVPGSKTLVGQRIVKGTGLPADTAMVDATVRLPAVKRETTTPVRVTGPAGHLAIAYVPRAADGRDPAFRGAGVSEAGQLEHSRFVDFEVTWRTTSPPRTVTATLGPMCEKPPLRKRGSIDPLKPAP